MSNRQLPQTENTTAEQLVPPSMTRSLRNRQPPKRFGVIDYERELFDRDRNCFLTHKIYMSNINGEPQSFSDIHNQNSKEWLDSINDEMDALKRNNTFELVTKVPSNCKIIKSKFVFKSKVNSDKTIRKKTRLVACGYS